ncbi:MAG: hypothetical protein ABJC12_01800 [Saprospiraceae bacterium]
MKFKFLNARNCHALLPPSNGLPLLHQLDNCLKGINEKSGGLIEALIKQNEKTIGRSPGSIRLINSPFEIAQNGNIPSGTVHTQAIQRNWPRPALFHSVQFYENQITWKAIVPLQFLLKGWGDANFGYQCYIQAVSHNMNQVEDFSDFKKLQERDSDSFYYVGITGRDWLLRLKEHVDEMRRGSNRRFHAAWRESMGMKHVLFTSSLMDVNQTFEGAMNWEESNVDSVAYGPNGLNMIPGGFKGLKYLHKLRITNSVNIDLEEREKAIAEYIRQNPRKGIPNPFISKLWEDDEYYLKVIEARPKTLSPDQVRMIRELNKFGRSVSEIVTEVGALNDTQVKGVIMGKTYTRII